MAYYFAREKTMPRQKKTCPFSDNTCSCCRALFADEDPARSGKKLTGCHLAEKNSGSKDK